VADLPTLQRRAAEALAKLVAAGRVRGAWLPGMMVADGGGLRVLRLPTHAPTGRGCGYIEGDTGEVYPCDGYVPCPVCEPENFAGRAPDLSDPLTVQGLVLLAREAWGVGSMVYHPTDGAIRAWRFVTFAHGADWLTPARLLGEGHTEAEAAIAAIEAAAEVPHADR
jgi:hypothetical protein